MTDHHASLAVETGHAADHRQIIGKVAVAVQFLEVGEALVHVIHRVGALRVTRNLRDLPRRQAGVDVFCELNAFFAEPINFFRNIDR